MEASFQKPLEAPYHEPNNLKLVGILFKNYNMYRGSTIQWYVSECKCTFSAHFGCPGFTNHAIWWLILACRHTTELPKHVMDKVTEKRHAHTWKRELKCVLILTQKI